ncbi:tripartite motif-containing protein 16 isoform X2 [Salminus brasiliensis]|uniref:tripartite motif-containing protein 16 isoform X2 n=1 Tax=Salminus brasiliensis TaxID=930266 RepID=UPI003B839708
MGDEAPSRSPDFSPAAPADVACDVCTGRKRKAEQTCLECLTSYCEPHLEQHNSLHGGKRHRLVEATERLQERICPEHGKLLEVFCRTDQRCICYPCITDSHRTHDVISIEVEVAEAHMRLGTTQREIADRVKTREKEVQELQQAIEAFKGLSTLPALSPARDAVVFFVHPYCSFELSTQAVADLTKQLSHICQSCFTTIAEKVRKAVILSAPAPKMREDFLQYACNLSLNRNTAHMCLRFSKENREVTTVSLLEDYPDHPDRFDCRSQILCNEGLEGRNPQYWEVEYGGRHWVCIAVSYIGVKRKGKYGPLFGKNRCSWGLRCSATSYRFWHNNKNWTVNYDRPCSKIGVYLDHRAGVLAFYNVLDSMSLIYKVQTEFTEPVYPGFGLAGKGTRIKLCDVSEDGGIEEKAPLSYSTTRPPWMPSACMD